MSRQDRLARNAESVSKAEHHWEPWSSDEVEFLLSEFPAARGKPEDEAALAELLGRTIEACRERFYKTMRGKARVVSHKETTTTTTETTTSYLGAHDDPEDAWWSPDYYSEEGT